MFKVVLFDLDGTLTDPKIGITKCVQHALRFFDYMEKPKEICYNFMNYVYRSNSSKCVNFSPKTGN